MDYAIGHVLQEFDCISAQNVSEFNLCDWGLIPAIYGSLITISPQFGKFK